MKIKVTKTQSINVLGRIGMCCGSCCAPMGVN
jgi:Mb-OB3b family methanobactin precursor